MNDIIIRLILFLTLIIIGYFFGKYYERKSFRKILEQEQQLKAIKLLNIKKIEDREIESVTLVQGECVIATDYFKTFCGTIRNIFGGRVKSFDSMLERGRKTATVRMLQQASRINADSVYNYRLETSSLSNLRGKNTFPIVEIFAYGTAVKFKK